MMIVGGEIQRTGVRECVLQLYTCLWYKEMPVQDVTRECEERDEVDGLMALHGEMVASIRTPTWAGIPEWHFGPFSQRTTTPQQRSFANSNSVLLRVFRKGSLHAMRWTFVNENEPALLAREDQPPEGVGGASVAFVVYASSILKTASASQAWPPFQHSRLRRQKWDTEAQTEPWQNSTCKSYRHMGSRGRLDRNVLPNLLRVLSFLVPSSTASCRIWLDD